MDYTDYLKRPGKDRLYGNLACCTAGQPGFARLVWGEDLLAPEALSIHLLAGGRLQSFAVDHLDWLPGHIVAQHSCDDLVLAERKFICDETLVDELTFTNRSSQPLRASVVAVCHLEGRKAMTTWAPLPAAGGAPAALVDLRGSKRVCVAFGANRTPDRTRWAPFLPTLVRALEAANEPAGGDTYKQDLLTAGMRWDLTLAPGELVSWTLAYAIGPTPESARGRLAAALADPAGSLEAVEQGWRSFFAEQVPGFESSLPQVADVYHYAWFVLQANRVDVGTRRLPWPFAVPARIKYGHLWFWDACLQAITLRWLRDPSYSMGNLRSAANQQYPDGLIPHETALLAGAMAWNWPDGDGQSSSVTQPPVLALALWEVYRVTGCQDLLAELAPALERYDRWYRECRDEDGDGLYAFVHRWETGWDNSPRWDQGFDVEPVEVNALIALQSAVLARCAAALGRPADAERYRQAAEATGAALRDLMWCPQAGFFFDLAAGNRRLSVRTPAAFIPMLADIATPEQAAALVEHLRNPEEFWTEYPVPTVARNDPEFEPGNYWRGPTWIHVNWMVIQGLLRYNYRAEAGELARRTILLMAGQGPATCNECYNPLTGAEARTIDLGWSSLVADLIITCLGGLRPQDDGRLLCDPLDLRLGDFRLADVPYRGHRIGLAYDAQDGYRVSVDGRLIGQRPDLGPLGPFILV